MEMLRYGALSQADIGPDLLDGFCRRQKVMRCWRKEDGGWLLRDVPFTEDWDLSDLAQVLAGLAAAKALGGAVDAAFEGDAVVGFAVLEGELFGGELQYLQLSSLHVSLEHRGHGIGKTLFIRACDEARARGARKLYISAHSSQETQAFYRAMGCVEALEYNQRLAAEEPCDCQLEFVL